MNHFQKHFSACLIALAALLSPMQGAWAATAPALGTAAGFSVLGGIAVTCTDSVVTGDVGSGGAFTNTGCTVSGGMPPATDAAAFGANADLINAYTAVQSMPCTGTLLSTITGPVTLAPGVYCTGAALTGTGVLTLDGGGNANAVWIFKIGAALTGTGFSVIMANGGQPCNVFWAPTAGVTMTTSAFSGNILAGGATGSITLTGGTMAGRALANVAVTMTSVNVIGCAALPVPGTQPGSSSCKDKDGDHDDKDSDHHDHDNDHKSSHHNPFGSNDKHGGKK